MEQTCVKHLSLKPTTEGIQKEHDPAFLTPQHAFTIYCNTFEFVLEKDETIRSIWLKTKWRYHCASIFGDGKHIGDWYPEFNDMLSLITRPANLHEAYMRMTGRDNVLEPEEGQVNFILPLTIAHDTSETFGYISYFHKNIKVVYDFKQVAPETELYVEVKITKTE